VSLVGLRLDARRFLRAVLIAPPVGQLMVNLPPRVEWRLLARLRLGSALLAHALVPRGGPCHFDKLGSLVRAQ
jgi:hypothetical protein